MRTLTAIGQRWKRAAGASLTIALLAAVAVVGFTVLGSKVLVALKAAGNAEQVLGSGNSLGLLGFDAAEAKVAALYTKTAEGTLVKNWTFTDSPFLDSILVTNTLLDYNLVTNPNTPQPITGGLSLSFNQIASNPFLSPFANLIAQSGSYSFLSHLLFRVFSPLIDNILLPLVQTLAPINPSLAAFVTAVANLITTTVVSIIQALGAAQAAINALLPPNYQPQQTKLVHVMLPPGVPGNGFIVLFDP